MSSESHNYYDAHLHLQDSRLKKRIDDIVSTLRSHGVRKIVVNGTRESDWAEVTKLAKQYPDIVLPSYGMHPWFLKERSEGWFETLRELLKSGGAFLGEIGLDKWIKGYDLADQEAVLEKQLQLAIEFELPVSIHCLNSWGRLVDVLKRLPALPKGFLLHSYSGPLELVDDFLELGGYFSFSGYFMQDRKVKQWELLKRYPLDRLLIETDAPDMLLPEGDDLYSIIGGEGERINHPANIVGVYAFVAEKLGMDLEELCGVIEGNFRRFFI